MEENDLPFKGKKKIPCILAGGMVLHEVVSLFTGSFWAAELQGICSQTSHGSTAKKQVTLLPAYPASYAG